MTDLQNIRVSTSKYAVEGLMTLSMKASSCSSDSSEESNEKDDSSHVSREKPRKRPFPSMSSTPQGPESTPVFYAEKSHPRLTGKRPMRSRMTGDCDNSDDLPSSPPTEKGEVRYEGKCVVIMDDKLNGRKELMRHAKTGKDTMAYVLPKDRYNIFLYYGERPCNRVELVAYEEEHDDPLSDRVFQGGLSETHIRQWRGVKGTIRTGKQNTIETKNGAPKPTRAWRMKILVLSRHYANSWFQVRVHDGVNYHYSDPIVTRSRVNSISRSLQTSREPERRHRHSGETDMSSSGGISTTIQKKSGGTALSEETLLSLQKAMSDLVQESRRHTELLQEIIRKMKPSPPNNGDTPTEKNQENSSSRELLGVGLYSPRHVSDIVGISSINRWDWH